MRALREDTRFGRTRLQRRGGSSSGNWPCSCLAVGLRGGSAAVEDAAAANRAFTLDSGELPPGRRTGRGRTVFADFLAGGRSWQAGAARLAWR